MPIKVKAKSILVSYEKIETFLFLYVISLVLLSHILNIPPLIGLFLSLPSFLAVPYLFGKLVLDIVPSRILGFSDFIFSSPILLLTFSWFFGSSSIAVLFSLLTLGHLPFFVSTLPYFLLIAVGINIFYKVRTKRCTGNLTISTDFVLISLIIIFFSVFIVILEKEFDPFPNIYGDLYFMLPYNVQGAIRVVENGFFVGGRWPDVLFSALPYSLFKVEPLFFTWGAPFILAIIFTLGIFLFSFLISKRLSVAVLSSLIGILIGYTPYWPAQFMDLKSNIIIYAFFPLILCTIYQAIMRMKNESAEYKNTNLLLLGALIFSIYVSLNLPNLILAPSPELSLFIEFVVDPLSLFALLVLGMLFAFFLRNKPFGNLFALIFLYAIMFLFMHIDEALFFLLAIFIFLFLFNIGHKISRYIPFLLASVAAVFIYCQWAGLLTLYSQNAISALWDPSVRLSVPMNMSLIKKTYFEFAYPQTICLFLMLGSSFALISKKRSNLLMISMLSILLIIFFIPELQTYRILAELTPFISFILALGFLSLYECINYVAKRIRITRLRYLFSFVIVCIMVIAILPPLSGPFNDLRHSYTIPNSQNGFESSSIAEYEYNAAAWIRSNLPQTTLIISDYRTMLILDSLGNKIWLAGRAMSIEEIPLPYSLPVQEIKNNIFNANSSESAYQNVVSLPLDMHAEDRSYLKYLGVSTTNLTFVIAISSRTVQWINQENLNDVSLAPYFSIPENYTQIFDSSGHFKLIYTDANNYLRLYRVMEFD